MTVTKKKTLCTHWELKHNLVNFNINHVQLETEHIIKQRREAENSVHIKKKENITKKIHLIWSLS